jgi:hypothetical protein
MANQAAPRLVETCESLCEQLRRTVGLTSFRVELARAGAPLVVSLRSPEPAGAYDPRHEWMRPKLPAALEIPVQAGARKLGTVRIEDLRRERYPAEALAEGQRIVETYARDLAGLLAETGP